jgi:hypothetical protein
VQRKKVFLNLDDAIACQEEWETERIHGMAAARPKITWLTQEQIRKAETLFEMFRDSGIDLLDVGRHFIRTPPHVTVDKIWDEGLKEFTVYCAAHLSKSHFETCTLRCRRFGAWLR